METGQKTRIERRGGERARAGRPPVGFQKVKRYGLMRCNDCGRFVSGALMNDHKQECKARKK